MTLLAQELARERRTRDLTHAHEARLAEAIRRRRAVQRSNDRARRLVRLAGLAALRSDSLATGALGVAK